jgi:peptide/nickel transport system permease protein
MPEPADTAIVEPLEGRAAPPPLDADIQDVEELAAGVDVSRTQKLGVVGWMSIIWLAILILSAVLAPVLPLDDPDESFLEIVRKGPIQPGHLLGGDGSGHDMLARAIYAARTSLIIAVAAVGIAFVVGGLLGMVAGYFRGRTDTIMSTLFNVILSIPALVLVLAMVAVFASADENTSNAKRMSVLIAAIALVSVPLIARITRASTLSWSEREFVRASEVLGAKHSRIMVREVLPNVLPAMASIALLGIGVAMVVEGGLALLGASVTEVPTWGNMIALGRSDLARAPHIVGIPSVAIFLTILSLNVLGDVVRARFDVRESLL